MPRFSDSTKKCVLQTDANKIALGAQLVQYHGKTPDPKGYYCEILTDPECWYSIYELEALAIVSASNTLEVWFPGFGTKCKDSLYPQVF